MKNIGTGHVTLCHPVTISSVQETVLYGALAVDGEFVSVSLTEGGQHLPVLVPMSNVAGIVLDT